MSPTARTKRCVVAYATRDQQYLWTVELPLAASVNDALAAARGMAPDTDARWDDAEVGIFGEPCSRAHIPDDGDRIEIYRPLAQDPRQARRERARRLKGPRGRPRGSS